MDDEEYYRKMRDRNLNRGFTVPGKKKNVKKSLKESQSDFVQWKITQGREDAEMLYERSHNE